MLALYTLDELHEYIAKKIKQERVRQGSLTQREFAKKAGIPLSTYARLEQTGQGSIDDLIKTLIVLKRVDELELLIRNQEQETLEEKMLRLSRVAKKQRTKVCKKREKIA